MGTEHEGGEANPEPNGGVEFLDLDGDGVPDAIATTQVREFVEYDGADGVELIQEIERDIGVDGVPREVALVDIVEIDVDHDGEPDVTEITAVTVRERPAGAEAVDTADGGDEGDELA